MKPSHALAFLLTLMAAVAGSSAADQKPKTGQPDFAAGWRVTGVVRQGGKLQACIENTGVAARFVTEGDELVSGVVVEKIDRANRCVTLRHDTQTAVIGAGSAPVPAVTNTALAQPQQQSQPRKGGAPWSNGPSAAGQDDKGRWGVRNSDGQFFSTQDFVKRFGGLEKAIEHANKHLAEDTDPNRLSFHEQMLGALQNERDSSSPPKKGKHKKNSPR